MESQEMKSLIINKFGQCPVVGTKPIPEICEGEILVKVEASTINPSDQILMGGKFTKKKPPLTPGYEGVGWVVKTKSPELQTFIGKRVSFIASSGSWAEYAASSIFFVISDDVPLISAACGIINPLTALAMIFTYRRRAHKGIVNTAAASALGRQLNKMCIRYKIPLINIVRRKEQAEILRNEGATNIIVTEGSWEKHYRRLQSQHRYDAFFDALGGGEVAQKIVDGLPQPASVYIYGILEDKPFVIPKSSVFFSGFTVQSFNIWIWWKKCPEQQQSNIRAIYSDLLKAELSTQKYRQYNFTDIKQALKQGKAHSTRGKILLLP